MKKSTKSTGIAITAGLICAGLWWVSAPRFAVAADVDAGGAAASSDCDRACLENIVDQYMQALVNHNPALAPLAKDVKYSENEVALNIGDGLWGTISGKQDADLKFADPSHGEVGLYSVVEEHGNPAYLALRLKVVNHQITEAETIVSRRGDGVEQTMLRAGLPTAPGKFKPLVHDPAFTEDEPPEMRVSRSRLHDLVYGYFATMENNDGALLSNFDDNCKRVENGGGFGGFTQPRATAVPMAARGAPPSCVSGFKLGSFAWDTRVRERTTPLIDQERGLVLVRAFIDHAGTVTTYKTTDGVVHHSNITAPHTWGMLELFKIHNGKIYRIEAVYAGVPYGMPSPWYVFAKTGAWVTPDSP